MDFISHALWGGIAFGRSGKKLFIISAIISIMPDILSEGIMFTLAFLGLPGMPDVTGGTHPDITEFPAYAQFFYNSTHSLVFAAIIIIVICLIRRKIIWVLLAWPMHILIDIPTHSLNLFPTPFLYPLSDYRFNGIPWDHPYVLIPNILFLVYLYGIWIFIIIERRREKKAKEQNKPRKKKPIIKNE